MNNYHFFSLSTNNITLHGSFCLLQASSSLWVSLMDHQSLMIPAMHLSVLAFPDGAGGSYEAGSTSGH